MYSEASLKIHCNRYISALSALTHFSSVKHKPYVPYIGQLHKSYTIVQFLKCKILERCSSLVYHVKGFEKFWKVSPRWRCLACHPLQFLLWCFLDSALLCLQSNMRYGHGSFSCQIEYFHNSTMIYFACLMWRTLRNLYYIICKVWCEYRQKVCHYVVQPSPLPPHSVF